MIVVNTEAVPGKEITSLKGMVFGNTIRAKDLGRDVGAALKSLVGGELHSYTNLLSEARQEAVDRMVKNAEQVGANAIVNVRLTTATVANGAAEICAYGTAVVVM